MGVILSPGAHNAAVPVTVAPPGLSCAVQVVLTLDEAGTQLAAQSNVVPFTSQGILQMVNASVSIPSAGDYVFVGIFVNGILVGVWPNPPVRKPESIMTSVAYFSGGYWILGGVVTSFGSFAKAARVGILYASSSSGLNYPSDHMVWLQDFTVQPDGSTSFEFQMSFAHGFTLYYRAFMIDPEGNCTYGEIKSVFLP